VRFVRIGEEGGGTGALLGTKGERLKSQLIWGNSKRFPSPLMWRRVQLMGCRREGRVTASLKDTRFIS